MISSENEILTDREKCANYLDTVALSLILFARFDLDFANELRNAVGLRLGAASKLPQEHAAKAEQLAELARMILPADREAALKRTDWLFRRIGESVLAAPILKTWKEEEFDPFPKQIVVGIIRVAIPGVTLGRFRRKKKAMIIMRGRMKRTEPLYIQETISQILLDLIFKSVRVRAKGDFMKLEPDFFDWEADGFPVEIYKADQDKIRNISEHLSKIGAEHSKRGDELGLYMLAISPSADHLYAEISWELERVEF